MLAVSIAAARAAAAAGGTAAVALPGRRAACTSLPLPMVNVLSGGLHAPRGLAFQDFLVVPVGARRYSEALESRVRRSLGGREGAGRARADDAEGRRGRVRPAARRPEQALDLLARGDPAGRPPSRRRGRLRGRRRRQPLRTRRAVRAAWTRAASRRARARRALERLSAATRSSRSRTAWARTTGRAGRSSQAGSASGVQLLGDDLFSTDRASGAGHRGGRR